MGDYLLMKTLLLITTIVGTLLANDANTAWVDKQVAAIKPPRSGLSTQAINNVKSPFIIVKPKAKPGAKTASKRKAKAKPKTGVAVKKAPSAIGPLKLIAVLNNSALINGKWYKTNEKVRGYSVSKIDQKSVVLRKGKREKKLFISIANPKIKIQIK